MLKESLSKHLRTTKKHLESLKDLGVKTLEDFILYFPRAYSDESEMRTIEELVLDEVNVVQGRIKSIFTTKTRRGKVLTKAVLEDHTGKVDVIWFNQSYLSKMYFKGMEVIMTGKLKKAMGGFALQAPKVETLKKVQIHTGRTVPVYPGNDTISSKWVREKLHPLLRFTSFLEDYMPDEIVEKYGLMSYPEAVKNVHFPDDEEALIKARRRLGFDELFFIQLRNIQDRWMWQKAVEVEGRTMNLDKDLLEKFVSELPFELTGAQNRVIEEVLDDMSKPFPMLRLLQGDVGAGKTIVAASIALLIVKAGFQVGIMAPTEILAKQHFMGLMKQLQSYGVSVQFLSGSTKKSDRKRILEGLKLGTIDMIIGTHALIQEDVEFKNLGFVVIDEQHRFGVKQREVLKEQGNPHLLNMSATPIPRTLAMTIYGDQDISILDEMPKGRQEIITRIVPEKKRGDAYGWISDHVKKGRQVFVICPLVEDSEVLEVKSASAEYERLIDGPFNEFRLGLLHGRLKQEEKDAVMKDFADGKIDILVSTSVVEVGIDVPNASIILIEGSERFGLSQLHQFRGRVGRGKHQSYCFLFTDAKSQESLKRLKAMVKYSSGFKLSEIDLELRGPGEVYGVKQSGVPDLRMASLTDSKLIEEARGAAQFIVDEDPFMKKYDKLLAKMRSLENFEA